MQNLLREILSNPIAYYPILGEVMGLPSAIIFQQTMYWQKVKRGKEFYKTDAEFAEELGIPLRTFRTSKAELVKRGFVKLLKKGYPAKSYYLVDDECLEKLASVCPKSSISLSGIVNTVNETEQAGGGHTILYTETTTETTSVGEPLPPIFGRDRLKRIITVYSLLWFSSYRTKYQANFGAVGKNFKPLFDNLTEWQIAALIIIHFNWHGADGSDDFIFKKLESEMHPILWIPSKVNEYSTYLTNVCGVDFDDPEKIKEYVKTELRDSLKEGLQAGIIKNADSNNH